MTDAHCHVTGGDPTVRELLIGRNFVGVHPWDAVHEADFAKADGKPLPHLADAEVGKRVPARLMKIDSVDLIRSRLLADPRLGVGEIGLDRLKSRDIPPQMREVFEAQLKLALEFRRPVVLHGAKCWGQVIQTIHSIIRLFGYSVISSFLFHGFSRSDGLIPEIVKLNGYISVGPAVLNDHAVNYRELVKKIPLDRLLLETDRTAENAATCPSVADVAAKVAELRGLPVAELEKVVDANAERFVKGE